MRFDSRAAELSNKGTHCESSDLNRSAGPQILITAIGVPARSNIGAATEADPSCLSPTD
jgi:hypothetical protein